MVKTYVVTRGPELAGGWGVGAVGGGYLNKWPPVAQREENVYICSTGCFCPAGCP